MKLPNPYIPEEGLVNIIIETPYKSRNKYTYEPDMDIFKLSKVLPAGLAFPCDMGFVPNTKGEDGDPLDALIIMDEITYPGCLVEGRLIGVIEAIQTEKGTSFRNDRILAVPGKMHDLDHIKTIEDLNNNKLDAIIKFFEYYNDFDEKKFEIIKIHGPAEALQLINNQRI